MVGEVGRVLFVDADKMMESLEQARKWEQPLGLFATNYQWMALYEQGRTFHLPHHSLVFETGGSKGLAEECTYAEVKRRLAYMFA